MWTYYSVYGSKIYFVEVGNNILNLTTLRHAIACQGYIKGGSECVNYCY